MRPPGFFLLGLLLIAAQAVSIGSSRAQDDEPFSEKVPLLDNPRPNASVYHDGLRLPRVFPAPVIDSGTTSTNVSPSGSTSGSSAGISGVAPSGFNVMPAAGVDGTPPGMVNGMPPGNFNGMPPGGFNGRFEGRLRHGFDGASSNGSFGTSSIEELERHLFDLVNKDRADNGSGALQNDSRLNNLARMYAEMLLAKNFFSHIDPSGRNPQQRAADAGLRCQVYENLGWQKGSVSDLQKVDDLEKSFLNEPRNQRNHRYNLLLEKHQFVGVGVAKLKDQLIIVEEFSDQTP